MVAEKIAGFLNELGGTSKAMATYHSNYVRRGSIFNSGEQGILLNDISIDVLVNDMIRRIETLSIRQAKGYMYVDSVEFDYNENATGKNMLRIKTDPGEVISEKGDAAYAIYFQGV